MAAEEGRATVPVRKTTLWPLKPHTRAKHRILRRYLEAWFPILSRHHGRIVYVDGFSGPGRYQDGEEGSPIIALNVALHHLRALQGEVEFWFIDERRDRIRHLRGEVAKLSLPHHFRVNIERGRCADKIGATLDGLAAESVGIAPTFAFLDPSGFSGIPCSFVARLLAQPRCEVLITLDVCHINRFLRHRSPAVVRHIIEAFGTEKVASVADMAGDRIAALRELYRGQLLQAGAKSVLSFEMRNRRNQPQYLLFFASKHRLGHVKMKDAMWQVDPDGRFRFSDAADPCQLVLLRPEPHTELLDLLVKEFGRSGCVTGEQVRRFVDDNTLFLDRHKTAALREAESDGRLLVDSTKADGGKRKSGTFPNDCRMRFIVPN